MSSPQREACKQFLRKGKTMPAKMQPEYRTHFTPAVSWEDLKKDPSGLVPCIVQDAENGDVLMMAWMDRAAFEETAENGVMCYYSRSRKERWLKGETSGHFQYVKELYVDCDSDTLLAKVEQSGAACHTGARSCFFRKVLTR